MRIQKAGKRAGFKFSRTPFIAPGKMYKRDTFWGFCPSLGTRFGPEGMYIKTENWEESKPRSKKKEGYNAFE